MSKKFQFFTPKNGHSTTAAKQQSINPFVGNNKGDIKMFETSAVLIVFFFLLTISVAFYYNMSYSNQQKELGEIRRINTFQTAVKTFFMPEFDCSFGGIKLSNCYDEIKVRKFADLFDSNDFFRSVYVQVFGTSVIKVSEVYPVSKEILVYNFTPASFNNKITSFTPVLLYNPNNNGSCFGLIGGCGFGIVEVSYYD